MVYSDEIIPPTSPAIFPPYVVKDVFFTSQFSKFAVCVDANPTRPACVAYELLYPFELNILFSDLQLLKLISPTRIADPTIAETSNCPLFLALKLVLFTLQFVIFTPVGLPPSMYPIIPAT